MLELLSQFHLCHMNNYLNFHAQLQNQDLCVWIMNVLDHKCFGSSMFWIKKKRKKECHDQVNVVREYFFVPKKKKKKKKNIFMVNSLIKKNVRNLIALLYARSASSKRLGPISFNALPIFDHASAKSGDKRNASS